MSSSEQTSLNGRVSDVTDEQRQKYYESFLLFDTDKDGKISNTDLYLMLRLLGIDVTQEDVNVMIDKMGNHSDEGLSFDDFLDFMTRPEPNTEETNEDMRKTFKSFDKDGDGMISAADLKLAMRELGEDLSDAQISHMMEQADTNKDGLLNYHEFTKAMQGCSS